MTESVVSAPATGVPADAAARPVPAASLPSRAAVLVACDSFGGTLSAPEACDAVAAGWTSERPGDHVVLAPQSDGGPGFVAALAPHLPGARILSRTVTGPTGIPVRARWLWHEATATAYIETAEAIGLHLLGHPPDARSATMATTGGAGELVAGAVDAGARTIVVGLGGTATTDGGRGFCAALGGPNAAVAALREVRVVMASDVTNPLCGVTGAAMVFGRQKGAGPAERARLDRDNMRWAEVLRRETGADVVDLPGAGAAGGLGAFLLAVGAEREPGAAVVERVTGRESLVAAADVVITGEGRTDAQTLGGKVAHALAESARRHRVPVVLVSGQITLGSEDLGGAGFTVWESAAGVAGSPAAAMAEAARWVTAAAAAVARTFASEC